MTYIEMIYIHWNFTTSKMKKVQNLQKSIKVQKKTKKIKAKILGIRILSLYSFFAQYEKFFTRCIYNVDICAMPIHISSSGLNSNTSLSLQIHEIHKSTNCVFSFNLKDIASMWPMIFIQKIFLKKPIPELQNSVHFYVGKNTSCICCILPA